MLLSTGVGGPKSNSTSIGLIISSYTLKVFPTPVPRGKGLYSLINPVC